MSELTKVRMQILDAETDEVLEEVDVLSSASSILFPDGINLEEKIDQIEKMEGPQGPKGDIGATGPQGPKGDTGAKGATGALYLGKVTVCKNAVSIKPPRYGY